jgi:hypothetical protein
LSLRFRAIFIVTVEALFLLPIASTFATGWGASISVLCPFLRHSATSIAFVPWASWSAIWLNFLSLAKTIPPPTAEDGHNLVKKIVFQAVIRFDIDQTFWGALIANGLCI